MLLYVGSIIKGRRSICISELCLLEGSWLLRSILIGPMVGDLGNSVQDDWREARYLGGLTLVIILILELEDMVVSVVSGWVVLEVFLQVTFLLLVLDLKVVPIGVVSVFF